MWLAVAIGFVAMRTEGTDDPAVIRTPKLDHYGIHLIPTYSAR